MDVLRVLVRATVRRGLGVMVGVAMLVAAGVGTGIAVLTIAWKTDHAYPEYLHRADVGELVVNPRLLTDRLVDAISSTPGVQNIVSDDLLNASVNDSKPQTRGESGSGTTAVVGSLNGRYVTRDRPVILRGRMAQAGDEVFLSTSSAAQYDVDIGDELALTFWPTAPSDAPSDVIVYPIATHQVRVVGIGVFADEVLPDELFPHQRIVVGPDLARQYICTPVQPPPDDPRSIEELLGVFFPPNCSNDVRFFSFDVGGDQNVDTVLNALNERFATESERLPAALRAIGASFSSIPTVTANERDRIERSLEPTITTLRLLGLAILIATIVIVTLVLLRAARSREEDIAVWTQLGLTRGQRVIALSLPSMLAVGCGVAAAVAFGWVVSGVGPVGSVSSLSPGTDFGMPVPLAVVTFVSALGGLVLAVFATAWWAARSREPVVASQSRSRLAGAAVSNGSVSMALGIRAGLRSRGGNAALLGAISVAVALVVAAGLFSVNVLRTVDQPARFGWPYDVGVLINYGYDGVDRDAVADTLRRADVARWGLAGTYLQATIDDTSLPVVADVQGFADLGITVIDGSLPHGDHEIAIGSRSAAATGVRIGDTVTVSTEFGDRDATITGVVVLPPLGSFLADRAALGTGALASGPFYTALLQNGERIAAMPAGSLTGYSGGFVGIDLRDGTDVGAFVRSIEPELRSWDVNGVDPFVYTRPVRPAQISNVGSMRSGPVLLAAIVAAALLTGLGLSLHRAARARRRELAVLRALGCASRQMYSTLRWQAVTTAIVGLAIGLPVGVIVGRMTWRSFASGLGLAPAPQVPMVLLVIVGLGTLASSVVLAIAPAHLAVRTSPAAALRGE